MPTRREEIGSRIAAIRERIARAAARVGRDPASVRLLGAAKTMPAAVVRAAIAAGLNEVGENYVQEAEAVRPEIDLAARWHLIGHLQRNKAGRAAALFDVVQTVDRLALGVALDRHAAALDKVLGVFVEVNIGGEATKSGVAPARVAELVAELRRLPSLRVDGLMTIPPPSGTDEARRYFRAMRDLRDESQLGDLSMGMSDDFEIAVEEGATLVRVGRAIFGERS